MDYDADQIAARHEGGTPLFSTTPPPGALTLKVQGNNPAYEPSHPIFDMRAMRGGPAPS